MSHLQLNNALLPNMSKGIISLWFKGAVSKAADAPVEDWPNAPPPNPQQGLPIPVESAFVFYDPYGLPINTLFPIRGPAPLIYPFPPVTHVWGYGTDAGKLPHDKFNFILTLGDPSQEFQFRKWECKKISEFDGVVEIPGPFNYADWPPPYRAYYKVWPTGPHAGEPLGADGQLSVYNLQLAEEIEPITDIIPQSFIGVTSQGELRILLQTSTRAEYNGYHYTMDKAEALFAQSTIFIAPITTPPTPGTWGYIGPYWAGYQFTYKDTSKELMTAWPEFFMINGPLVGEGWNHLLFSFDISGNVSLTVSGAYPGLLSPQLTTRCKAWIAVNDQNWTGNVLQWFPTPLPYDSRMPQPIQAIWNRDQLRLGPNDIIPQNVFLHGFMGNPRDNLPRAYAADVGGHRTGYVDQLNPYAYISFLGLGGGPGIVDPVTVPDPKTFPPTSYDCDGYSIPTAGHPIGIPAIKQHAGHIKGVYMAELQIWAGKTLDTGVLANRRLFIDAEGKPTKMSVAEQALGKPDIVLHTTSNWKKGKNTGTIEQPFAPSGSIVKYEPDPELGK